MQSDWIDYFLVTRHNYYNYAKQTRPFLFLCIYQATICNTWFMKYTKDLAAFR